METWVNAIIWAAVMGGFTVYAIRKERRHAERRPLAEPISHVRPSPLHPSGRVLKIGIDCHARACVDDEGKVECVCGLSNREAGARMLDDAALDRLEGNPDLSWHDARLGAWAELHGETGGVA